MKAVTVLVILALVATTIDASNRMKNLKTRHGALSRTHTPDPTVVDTLVNELWTNNFFICHQVVHNNFDSAADDEPTLAKPAAFAKFGGELKAQMKELALKSDSYVALLEFFKTKKIYFLPLFNPYDDYGWAPTTVASRGTDGVCVFNPSIALSKEAFKSANEGPNKDQSVIFIDEKLMKFDTKINEAKWEGTPVKLIKQENKKLDTPASICIAHELIHTYHFFKGCYLAYDSALNLLKEAPFSYTQEQVTNMKNLGHYSSSEEWVTVGTDPTYVNGNAQALMTKTHFPLGDACVLDIPVTENKIRTEAGLPFRVQYTN